jgi:prepilin-type N-terminal cleavage/methylation domain-containing protein
MAGEYLGMNLMKMSHFAGQSRDRCGGFTLIELMIVMLISGVIAAAAFAVYQSQQRAYTQVEQTSAVQQNLRSALYYIENELKMAGCDPTETAMTNFGNNNGITPLPGYNGLVVSNFDAVRFVMDLRGPAAATDPYDGEIDTNLEPLEDVTYALDPVSGTTLLRNGVVIADNVDAIDFVYLDRNLTALNLPDGAGGPTDLTDASSITGVFYVQVTLVMRAPKAERGYTSPASYQNLQGATIYTPPAATRNFRRRALTSTIRVRNMGL